jgi:hypothetical protein
LIVLKNTSLSTSDVNWDESKDDSAIAHATIAFKATVYVDPEYFDPNSNFSKAKIIVIFFVVFGLLIVLGLLCLYVYCAYKKAKQNEQN